MVKDGQRRPGDHLLDVLAGPEEARAQRRVAPDHPSEGVLESVLVDLLAQVPDHLPDTGPGGGCGEGVEEEPVLDGGEGIACLDLVGS